MLTLTLLRHAKSSWAEPGLPDIERPLKDRGRKAAPRMGAVMRERWLSPDHILCSTAVRTRQTLGLVLEAYPELARAGRAYDERLYLASGKYLLSVAQSLPPPVGHALLVGHNPGLHELAVMLAGSGERSLLQSLASKLPTGALVVLDFDVERFSLIRPKSGALRLFIKPRDLEDHRAG